MRPPEIIILRNGARCSHCGDEVESTHRHDFKWCRCGKLGVDGGHDYIRRIGSLGQDTSIVAIREMDDPEADGALNFPDQIRSSWGPVLSDYADAPLLQGWHRHVIEVARRPAPALIGTVTGHPEFPDGTVMVTTRVPAGDEGEGWVRTTRRFYRLGDRRS